MTTIEQTYTIWAITMKIKRHISIPGGVQTLKSERFQGDFVIRYSYSIQHDIYLAKVSHGHHHA